MIAERTFALYDPLAGLPALAWLRRVRWPSWRDNTARSLVERQDALDLAKNFQVRTISFNPMEPRLGVELWTVIHSIRRRPQRYTLCFDRNPRDRDVFY
jgi:hypothetical protein